MLDRLILSNFRNHHDTVVEGTARFNLLVGENGAGKTNVLEALSLFAPGRGMRRAQLADMASRNGPGGFTLSAQAQDGLRMGTGTLPERTGRRTVLVNGAQASALSLGEWLSIGWLTPDMDRLFAEGPGARRRHLDRMALSINPGHARASARLEGALRERNRMLCDPVAPDSDWLDAIEAQIAEAGAEVSASRATLVARLNRTLSSLPDGPFARPILDYAPGGPVDAPELCRSLGENRQRDRAAQRTLSGPHRDDLMVTMAGKNQPAAACSTGEQKAMLIAVTLAHASLADSARPGLLLLDEVAAHIDPVRREAMFDRLRTSGAQVWLTGTEPAPFEAILGEAAVWRVSDGRVERQA